MFGEIIQIYIFEAEITLKALETKFSTYPLTIVLKNPTRHDIISIKYMENDKRSNNFDDYGTPSISTLLLFDLLIFLYQSKVLRAKYIIYMR